MYNPKRVTGSFQPAGGPSIQFKGYMDGSFIDLDQSEDAVTVHVGAAGFVTAVLNPNNTAVLVVTFMQGSPTNDALDTYVPRAKDNYFPTGTLTINDLNGTTICTDSGAWIVRRPKIVFGAQVQGREWKFLLPDPTVVSGGDGS